MNAALREPAAGVASRVVPSRSVVLVGPLPPPSGGMANQTRQLASLLAAEGCNVQVVQNNAAYRPAWIGAVRGVRAVARLVPYVVRLWRSISAQSIVHVMANSGWSWHLFCAPAVWIAALHRAPVVVNYRGGNAAEFLARQMAFVRPTLKRVSLLVVPSGFLADVFARHGVDATIVPNVVDLAAFSPAPVLADEPRIVITRNLEKIYGIDTALRAFALVVRRYPAATLVIAGSGPERGALESLASELGIASAVQFTGRVDNAELPALYRSARVFLNASLIDNMPNSILEALASGVPVVSTNAGGIPYLVRDGTTALLVPPSRPEALAEAVLRVLDDRALAGELRNAGLDLVRQYAWPAVRERLFAAYERAWGTRHGRRVSA